ncbi:MAG: ATP-binding protein, partial [Vicinamibacterales bacterium]
MPDFEKLGLFYLGRRHDLETAKTLDEPMLYDSRDLVTHAVCVGMTGSGKTGLCVGLIEEAAIDGIPVIAIDPKGDLGNLLLTFPGLSASEFRPWVDEGEARRAGVSADSFAAQQAELWSDGLAQWGQGGNRIEKLRKSAEFGIFTPGSRAGRPVSILRSFAAPVEAERNDNELLAERASGTATSALVLAGVDAAPRSREHSLVAALLTSAWQRGEALDLAALIRQVQSPPFDKIGVVDLESFYPAKERFELAMRLNGVLAAPGFDSWLEGEPLDPDVLLHTREGRPRVSVFSIAHLGDAERMFFVSLLLNQVVGWMRRQTGTASLRAIVYMDEIAGYFPPVATPPSKAPLLTMLKQGRAFGLGVVLATQNPVDLDYKGLSNTGTWFLGRLQTERDKARLLDGLEGASGALDRATADRALSALKKRIFLMHNVHETAPAIFETRWTLSYLRGPLSRDQVRMLTPAAAPAARDEGAVEPA